MPRHTNVTKALVTATRDERILKLRLSGMSHTDIAHEIGVHVNTVAKSLKRSHARLTERCYESASELVFRQSQQLEKMFQRLYEETVETRDGEAVPVDNGTARRIEVMLKVQERYSKLLGLDAPEKTQTLSVGFNFQDMTPDEIRARLEQLGHDHRAAYGAVPQLEQHELPGEIEGEFLQLDKELEREFPRSEEALAQPVSDVDIGVSPSPDKSGSDSDPLDEGQPGTVSLESPVPSPPVDMGTGVPDSDRSWQPW